MKRYLAEYERWMLERPVPGSDMPVDGFRRLLRAEVEKLVAALREGVDFVPFWFDSTKEREEPPCNTSSVTT